MGDNAVEILEGELGVQLKEEPPPKPVRVRKSDVQSTKKKKEGTTSPRQVSKKGPKERARPTPNQHSSDDENPWDWITLNRCLLLSVVVIVVSTGVNSLNETVGVFWEVEDAELTAEELALRHGDVQQGNAPEESSLWDSLFWWSRRSRDGCDDDDDDCDDYDAVDDYDDDDDDAIDGDDDDDAVVDDDDGDDDDDDGDDDGDDDDDDDGDDSPGGKSRKVRAGKRGVHRESGREEDTEKPGKGLSGEPEEDTPKGKREKGRLTRQKHGGEEEEEEEEERPRRKRQRGAREQRQG